MSVPSGPEERRGALRVSSGGRPWFIVLRGRWGLAIDRFVVRLTGYSPVTKQYALARGDHYQPTLLLTTRGRRSGRPRSQAMAYWEDGGRLLIVGSHGGSPHDPLWVENLRAEPDCWIHVRRRRRAVRAEVAEGDERGRLFQRIVAERPHYGRYQERAAGFGRQLPVIILSSRDGRPLP